MRITDSIDIEASPSVVFAVNTDIEGLPKLTPTVTSVTRLDDGPLMVGSQARLKQPGQRPTTWTVTAIEPDRQFVWEATVMGVRTVATHLVEATPSGCRNTLSLEMSGRGSRLFSLLLGGRLRKVLRTENQGFQREAVLRAATAPPATPPTP